jgi:hypothetical protein
MKLKIVAFSTFNLLWWALCGILWEHVLKEALQVELFCQTVRQNNFSSTSKVAREAEAEKIASLMK